MDMKPDSSKVTIHENTEKINLLLNEVFIRPRVNLLKWSSITKQSPNIKIGYPGQHLASLITGVEGQRTGARGHDLNDGSEVKSCSRIDQLDKCLECSSPVSRFETNCPNCNSQNIKRNNDSKWLFSIRNESELRLLTKDVKRVVLILGDYPNYDSGDFDTLRFQAFELWPNSPRNARFAELMTNYYNNIFMEHRRRNSNATPAPKNFWPYSYQFYLCNPIKTFSCLIKNSTSENSKIIVEKYIEPSEDRTNKSSELMPTSILKPSEKSELEKTLGIKLGEFIDEKQRSHLPLRDTDRISTARSEYTRRTLV